MQRSRAIHAAAGVPAHGGASGGAASGASLDGGGAAQESTPDRAAGGSGDTSTDGAAGPADVGGVAGRLAVLEVGAGASQRRGVVVFLPRQTDLRQLSELVPEGRTVHVERAVLDGFVKGITAYFWM